MRDGDHIPLVHHLLIGKVCNVLIDNPLLDRLQQRLLVHDFSAGEVHELDTLFHHGKDVLIDISLCLIIQRHMDRDEISLGQNARQTVPVLDAARKLPRRID